MTMVMLWKIKQSKDKLVRSVIYSNEEIQQHKWDVMLFFFEVQTDETFLGDVRFKHIDNKLDS